MLERVLISLLVVLLSTGGYAVWQQWMRRRLDGVLAGGPAQRVLYFRSDGCASCATQARFLEQLRGDSAESAPLTVDTIDVERQPDAAARYGVLTLPTTIVVDRDGRVAHVNYGLADARKLARQLNLIA